MEVALFVAMFFGFFVGLVFATMTFLSPDTDRKQRATRDRDLARYKHHPEANLLSLND